MLICITFLDAPDYAIAPGVYGVAMYIGPALLALGAKRKMRNEQPSVSLQKTESV
jgi:BASS family bile acid:Na+ symporter